MDTGANTSIDNAKMKRSPGTWATFVNNPDKVKCLQDLVYYLNGYPENYTRLDKDAKLYKDVYRLLVANPDETPQKGDDNGIGNGANVIIKGASAASSIYAAMAKVPSTIVCEASYVFAIYYLCYLFKQEQGRNGESKNDNLFIYELLDKHFFSTRNIDEKTKLQMFQQIFNPGIPLRGEGLHKPDSILRKIRDLVERCFLTKPSMNGVPDTLTVKLMRNFFSDLDNAKKEAIDDETNFMFQAITGDPNPALQNILIATGDGSETLGFINRAKYGIILFSYQLIETDSSNKLEPKHIIGTDETSTIDLRAGDPVDRVVHMRGIGFDSQVLSMVTAKVVRPNGNNVTLQFEGSTSTNNRLIATRNGNLTKFNYSTDKPDYDSPDERWNNVTNFTANREDQPFATYHNDTQNLILYDFKGTIGFSLQSAKNPNANISPYDEVQLMVNVDAIAVLPKRDLALIFNRKFGSEKFALTSTEITDLFQGYENAIRDIISLVRYQGYSFNTIKDGVSQIQGGFVGEKEVENDPSSKIIPDERYIPNLSFANSEQEIDAGGVPSNSDLRVSNITIQINPKNKTIDIYIVSFVSPNISYLHNVLEANKITLIKNNYVIDGYTVNASGNTIPSYNPILATLRSMGSLDALITKITQMANNDTVVIEKLNELKSTVTAIDQTAKLREAKIQSVDPDWDLNQSQIVHPVPFSVYENLK